MTDLLQRYWQKRDFGATPEPRGKTSRSGTSLSFVIQKHAARRLHYDFRLELDGTLKSWAVPKGPSLDPNDKRMAVHVEDHPLSYAGFEGVIPPGQYGAGTVVAWDRGTWEPVGDPREGLRDGKLRFVLHGHKLQGGWALVRMHGRESERQEPWLLIKERDDHARPVSEYSVVDEEPDSVLAPPAVPAPAAGRRAAKAPALRARPAKAAAPPEGAAPAKLPLTLAPQLATLVDRAPPGDEWLYEIKFDGYRLLARIEGGDVRLYTRNGNDWTSKLKGLAEALAALALPPCWLDGEIVVPGPHGAPDFNALQNAFDSSRTDRVRLCLFDAPFFDGRDLRQMPLVERRALLRRVLQAPHDERIAFSDDFRARPEEILANACRMRLEGVIGKRRDAPYVSGRSKSWIKLKCTHRQEFVVVGWTDPEGARVGLGALLLGFHEPDGTLRYAGKVGTGFDARTLAALRKRLSPLEAERPPFPGKPPEPSAHWVRPRLVAEVSFSEWTPDGRIRHAAFHGLRDDKPAAAITREEPVPAQAVAGTRPAARKPAADLPALPADLRITHPERVIDATTGLTKRDLVDWYLRAARHMLPHLAQRPVALVRAPSGVQAQLFFQKHAQTLKIPGLKRLDPELDPGHPPLIEIDSFTALVGAAQMNVVEFHTWNAKRTHIEKPDRVTFDLDPGEGVAWAAMLEAAGLVRALLDELSLVSFLKTSGGKGLHVVVPIAPRHGWDTVREFSRAAVQHLAAVVPGRFVAKSGAQNRVGRIYVDYLRNGRGATTAAAYSVRARPGLGVSMPCAWDELSGLAAGDQWTIANGHERLSRSDDPWAAYATTKQTLARAMKALHFEG
jgi:bifunctional non-homologous end joining protein LigD